MGKTNTKKSKKNKLDTATPENTGIIRNKIGQFVKGVSGNPSGKPPGSLSLTARLKKLLDQVSDTDPKKREYAELLVRKLVVSKALNEGDMQAIKEIFNRIDGPVEEGGGTNTYIIPVIVKKSEEKRVIIQVPNDRNTTSIQGN